MTTTALEPILSPRAQAGMILELVNRTITVDLVRQVAQPFFDEICESLQREVVKKIGLQIKQQCINRVRSGGGVGGDPTPKGARAKR